MEQIVLEREGREPLTLIIDEEVRDDAELFDALCELDDKNFMALSKVITMILGKEQKKVLYDWLRGENGRVKLTEVSEAITDIFSKIGDGTKK